MTLYGEGMSDYNRRSKELRQEAWEQACTFMPEHDHAQALTRGKALVEVVNELMDDHIRAARATGMTWQQIADALGVSQQAASKRGLRAMRLSR